MIQQAILQILTPIFEKEFSNNSYWFRPRRKAHDAIQKAKEFIEEWNDYVVDLDIEKFFDNVNHDKLIWYINRRIKDKVLLKLLRKYLKTWILENGVVTRTEIWTPQWWPLSPLLANILLHEFDVELEKRWHKFCRYADDCNIYMKSERAWQRVLENIEKYLWEKLHLKVNRDKSDVWTPYKRNFLWFSFYKWKDWKVKVRVSKKSKTTFKRKLKDLTKRIQAWTWSYIIDKVKKYTTWWVWYYHIWDMKSFLEDIAWWLRRRMLIWKRWKKVKTRYKRLKWFWLNHNNAYKYANTRKWYWRIAGSQIMLVTVTNKYLLQAGFPNFIKFYDKLRLI